MPFIKLQFKPGLNRDQTNYSNEGGWWECDKIRFRSGYPEKIGGWTKATPTAYLGICRQMWNWFTTFNDDFLSIGTNDKVYIEAGGYYSDITPLRTTSPTLASPITNNCIATSNTLTTVTITLSSAHGATTGSFVTISGATAVGGIPATTLNANHRITVTSAFAFTITVSTAATSTVAAGGGTAISISFEIDTGYALTTFGYGWGAGAWGRNGWGLGADMPVTLLQRDWWINNFDNDLVMNIRNGPVYWWVRGSADDPSSALDTRAVTLQAYATASGYSASAVPAQVMQIMVSQNDKHLIAFGAVPYGSTDVADFDPLLIRWADQDNPAQWTPGVTNSSGFLRVSRGSRIVCAAPTRQETLIWTDSNLYALQFLGTTDVFGLQEYADNISIASPRCIATAANVTYWMGQDKFYAYTGRVETLPCTLRNHVFQNINFAQSDQIICGSNEQWNEIWWFYPTATSDYNDAYVIYNYLEKIWYYGSMERTAWLDTPLRHFPQATATIDQTATYPSGYIYNHEDGIDAAGEAITAYIQSNDFDIGDGDGFMLSRRLIPDLGFNNSTATAPEAIFELQSRNFPGQTLRADSSDSQKVIQTVVDQYTDQVFIRARARQMAIKVMSTGAGVQWQLGAPRLDVKQDGRR